MEAAEAAANLPGAAGFKLFVTALRAAFPDFQYTVDDVIAEGDKVAVRLSVRGTQKGELMGVPPTGKTITFGGVNIMRMVNGKVVEEWIYRDTVGMMRQWRLNFVRAVSVSSANIFPS